MFTLCSLYVVQFNMLIHNIHVLSVHNKLLYSKQTKGTQFACLFCYLGNTIYIKYVMYNVTVQLIRNIKCDTCMHHCIDGGPNEYKVQKLACIQYPQMCSMSLLLYLPGLFTIMVVMLLLKILSMHLLCISVCFFLIFP